MDTLMERIKDIRVETSIGIGTLCLEAIAELQNVLSSVPEEYQKAAYVETEIDNSCAYSTLYITYSRPEISEEVLIRAENQSKDMLYRLRQDPVLKDVFLKMIEGNL
jgi:hypothetical protein